MTETLYESTGLMFPPFWNGGIPAFVFNGLSTFHGSPECPWDELDVPTEKHTRDAIATGYWLNGWNVKVEHKIPNCGRIDILALGSVDNTPIIIEVKQKIDTSFLAVQALSQVSTYQAFMNCKSFHSAYVAAASFDKYVMNNGPRLAFPSINTGNVLDCIAFGAERASKDDQCKHRSRLRQRSIQFLLATFEGINNVAALQA